MKDEQRSAPNAGAARASAEPRRTMRAARQLDVFAGHDVRGASRQLELFATPAAGDVTHGAQ